MKTVRIFSLCTLALGILFGFLMEGPFGAFIGFLLASGFCVAICYVGGIIADNHLAADPPQEYVVCESSPKAPGRPLYEITTSSRPLVAGRWLPEAEKQN